MGSAHRSASEEKTSRRLRKRQRVLPWAWRPPEKLVQTRSRSWQQTLKPPSRFAPERPVTAPSRTRRCGILQRSFTQTSWKGQASPSPISSSLRAMKRHLRTSELKKAGRQSQSIRGSVELGFPNFFSNAFFEKTPSSDFPRVLDCCYKLFWETDSILEAAVNSILECVNSAVLPSPAPVTRLTSYILSWQKQWERSPVSSLLGLSSQVILSLSVLAFLFKSNTRGYRETFPAVDPY